MRVYTEYLTLWERGSCMSLPNAGGVCILIVLLQNVPWST
jgi:hypothetical protein